MSYPPAYGNCHCDCHRSPMMHIVACCGPDEYTWPHKSHAVSIVITDDEADKAAERANMTRDEYLDALRKTV